jgi:cysteinyl-tRNA synthetase
MDDDFNTPQAIAVLFGLSSQAHRAKTSGQLQEYQACANTLKILGGHLGLLQRPAQEFLQSGDLGISAAEIEELIAKRHAAKKSRDFATADQIRQDLLASGIVLEDQAGGITIWRKE